MHQEPVPQDPGRDGDPLRVPSWPDWMDDPAYLAARAEDEDPGDLDLDEDPDDAPPPGLEDAGVLDDAELEALIAEAREVTAGSGAGGGGRGPAGPGRYAGRDGRGGGRAAGSGDARVRAGVPG